MGFFKSLADAGIIPCRWGRPGARTTKNQGSSLWLWIEQQLKILSKNETLSLLGIFSMAVVVWYVLSALEGSDEERDGAEGGGTDSGEDPCLVSSGTSSGGDDDETDAAESSSKPRKKTGSQDSEAESSFSDCPASEVSEEEINSPQMEQQQPQQQRNTFETYNEQSNNKRSNKDRDPKDIQGIRRVLEMTAASMKTEMLPTLMPNVGDNLLVKTNRQKLDQNQPSVLGNWKDDLTKSQPVESPLRSRGIFRHRRERHGDDKKWMPIR